jgi:hypothetical protein
MYCDLSKRNESFDARQNSNHTEQTTKQKVVFNHYNI